MDSFVVPHDLVIFSMRLLLRVYYYLGISKITYASSQFSLSLVFNFVWSMYFIEKSKKGRKWKGQINKLQVSMWSRIYAHVICIRKKMKMGKLQWNQGNKCDGWLTPFLSRKVCTWPCTSDGESVFGVNKIKNKHTLKIFHRQHVHLLVSYLRRNKLYFPTWLHLGKSERKRKWTKMVIILPFVRRAWTR